MRRYCWLSGRSRNSGWEEGVVGSLISPAIYHDLEIMTFGTQRALYGDCSVRGAGVIRRGRSKDEQPEARAIARLQGIAGPHASPPLPISERPRSREPESTLLL